VGLQPQWEDGRLREICRGVERDVGRVDVEVAGLKGRAGWAHVVVRTAIAEEQDDQMLD